MREFVAHVRQRGAFRSTVVAALLVAALLLALGTSPEMTAVAVVAASFASLLSEYADTRNVRSGTRGVVLGAAAVVGGAVWAVSEPDVLPAVVLVVGGWLVLDGAVTLRYDLDGGESGTDAETEMFGPEDGGVVDQIAAFQGLGRVGRELEDGPATPAEVAAELDRSEPDVRESLEVLQEAGTVERDGDRYRLTGSGLQWRSWPGRVLRRLLRPFLVPLR